MLQVCRGLPRLEEFLREFQFINTRDLVGDQDRIPAPPTEAHRPLLPIDIRSKVQREHNANRVEYEEAPVVRRGNPHWRIQRELHPLRPRNHNVERRELSRKRDISSQVKPDELLAWAEIDQWM